MADNKGYIERFNLNQRLQHAVNAVACLILFATGLPIKYPDSLGYMASFIGGYTVTTTMHRFAGGAIVVLAIFHLLYNLVDREWWRTKDILPAWLDLTNIIKDTKFALGLSREKGTYGKYGYREKLDYWGAFIFFPILIATGLVMWHPTFFVAQGLLPDFLPAIRVVHSLDAILAGMAIMLHLYNVHLNPEFFPANWTMFTGEISAVKAKEEFPLWYERVVAEGKVHEEPATAPHAPTALEVSGGK
ncbi:MAG TPA: hypothetical protein HA257_06060 [Candidatus Methanoperedenaceae archaeon]|nr:hypothetical protein [Candidatus Methanoperedenaceae archaeon]